PPAARPGAASNDEGSAEGDGRDRQSDALLGGHPLSDGQHGRADGSGQGQELPGPADSPEGHGTPDPDYRESAAGAVAIQSGRARAGNSGASLPRGGRNPRVYFQADEREIAGVIRMNQILIHRRDAETQRPRRGNPDKV